MFKSGFLCYPFLTEWPHRGNTNTVGCTQKWSGCYQEQLGPILLGIDETRLWFRSHTWRYVIFLYVLNVLDTVFFAIRSTLTCNLHGFISNNYFALCPKNKGIQFLLELLCKDNLLHLKTIYLNIWQFLWISVKNK